jgi:pyruvate-formate lyase
MSDTKKSAGQLAASLYLETEYAGRPKAPPASVVHAMEAVQMALLEALLAAHQAGKVDLDSMSAGKLAHILTPYMADALDTPKTARKTIVGTIVSAVASVTAPKSGVKPGVVAKAAPKSGVKPAATKPVPKSGTKPVKKA